MYRNEAAVGEAVRASGLNREDLFISTIINLAAYGIVLTA